VQAPNSALRVKHSQKIELLNLQRGRAALSPPDHKSKNNVFVSRKHAFLYALTHAIHVTSFFTMPSLYHRRAGLARGKFKKIAGIFFET